MSKALLDTSGGTENELTRAIRARLATPKPDPFAFLKPVGDVAGNVGSAVGGAFSAAHDLPVVGGALDALGTIGDVTVNTPVGLAELGADKFLGTGLTEAAQRANAGRPFWELPKTAANLTRSAFGQIASDTEQTPLARAIAGLTGTVEDVGSFAAPIPGAGALGHIVGRGAEHLPSALEHSIGEVAPGAGFFESRQAPRVTAASRMSDEAAARIRQQMAEQEAARAARPATPPEDLAKRYPTSRADLENMQRRGEPIAEGAVTEDPTVIQLRDSLKARGIDPDTLKPPAPEPYTPQEPSEFVKSRPDKMAVHDANEAAIAAAQKGDWNAVQDALDRVKAAGGSLEHTASRMRDAGVLKATAGELEGAVRKGAAQEVPIWQRGDAGPAETPLAAAIAERTKPAGNAGRAAETFAAKIGRTTPVQKAVAADLAAQVERRSPGEIARETPGTRAYREANPSKSDLGAPLTAASNVVPIESIRDIKAKNAATLEQIKQRIASSRSEPPPAVPPPTPPAPPSGGPVPPPVPAAATPATALDHFLSVWNLPKALKASLDISAPFRQGVLLSAGHPGEFFGAFKPMLQALVNPRATQAVDDALRSVERPGLYLAPLDSAKLGAREEAFMSNLANKIPGISASNRAYVTFLNKLRADVYDNVLEGWEKGGKQVTEADRAGLANVINHFTGRGDLPHMGDTATAILNGAFFSPRFAISRVQSVGDALGGLRPGASLASREATADMLKFVGAGITILTLAQLGGAKVGLDPRSSDFGKIQIGNTSVDIWGGEQQLARYGAQLLTGQRVTATGKNAGKLEDQPRSDTLQRLIRSKLAPTTGTLNDIFGVVGGGGPTKKDREGNATRGFGDQIIGRNFIGEPVTPNDLPGTLATSLGWQDVAQNGPLGALSLLGFGVQHIDSNAPAAGPSGTPAPSASPPPSQKPSANPFLRASPSAPSSNPFLRNTGTQPATPTRNPFLDSGTSGPKPSRPSLTAPEDTGAAPQGDAASTVSRVAQQSGIDPKLALAIAQIESGMDPSAVGDNGDSHGLYQENVHGRGAGRAPDYDVARQTQRLAADIRAALAAGFSGTPGELAAAVQRPANPRGYAAKVNAIYARL